MSKLKFKAKIVKSGNGYSLYIPKHILKWTNLRGREKEKLNASLEDDVISVEVGENDA